MTRTFYNDRIRKTQNHGKPLHKDPCAAFVAGVDLKASADATWGQKSGPRSKWQKARVRTPASLEADLHS